MEATIKVTGTMVFNMDKDRSMCRDKVTKKEYFRIIF